MTAPRILIIAGSDSGGGAGIQADIKTVTLLGGHAMTAITAITAQNTIGVTRIMPVPADMVIAQIDAVADDIGIDAVKIGMIGSADVAEAVADRLEAMSTLPIVFDPVMVASSGAVLADAATIAAFRRLIEVATIVTPNAAELAALTGRAITDVENLLEAASELARSSGTAVLAKGGHLSGDPTDILVDANGAAWALPGVRVDTRHDHGTGCTLASAVAVGLARGEPLHDSTERAKAFVHAALLAAPGFGQGRGPMGHWAAGPLEG